MASFTETVVEACASVRSEVKHILVCLVSSSRRRELEQKEEDMEATMAEVSTVSMIVPYVCIQNMYSSGVPFQTAILG